MAKQAENRNIDFNGSSVRNLREGDPVSEDTLDRLEQITGGAEDPPAYRGDLARETAKLDAETEEELDALNVNMAQDDDSRQNTRYGTGIIADDVAREQLAGMTEAGADLEDRGVNSVAPGRDNTSSVLRRRTARSENVVDGNLDEPRNETRTDRDEGTAA
jgi:N utilization substance protein A